MYMVVSAEQRSRKRTKEELDSLLKEPDEVRNTWDMLQEIPLKILFDTLIKTTHLKITFQV